MVVIREKDYLVLEDDKLVEYRKEDYLQSIYLGKILKVMKSVGAMFIELKLEKKGYLEIKDEEI